MLPCVDPETAVCPKKIHVGYIPKRFESDTSLKPFEGEQFTRLSDFLSLPRKTATQL